MHREEWTPAEEDVLLELVEAHGKKWSKIGKLLNNRTENSVKNHFNSLLLRARRHMPAPVSVPVPGAPLSEVQFIRQYRDKKKKIDARPDKEKDRLEEGKGLPVLHSGIIENPSIDGQSSFNGFSISPFTPFSPFSPFIMVSHYSPSPLTQMLMHEVFIDPVNDSFFKE